MRQNHIAMHETYVIHSAIPFTFARNKAVINDRCDIIIGINFLDLFPSIDLLGDRGSGGPSLMRRTSKIPDRPQRFHLHAGHSGPRFHRYFQLGELMRMRVDGRLRRFRLGATAPAQHGNSQENDCKEAKPCEADARSARRRRDVRLHHLSLSPFVFSRRPIPTLSAQRISHLNLHLSFCESMSAHADTSCSLRTTRTFCLDVGGAH